MVFFIAGVPRGNFGPHFDSLVPLRLTQTITMYSKYKYFTVYLILGFEEIEYDPEIITKDILNVFFQCWGT